MRLAPRINPSVKLIVLLAISLALLPVFDPWTPTIVYGILLAATLAVAVAAARRPRVTTPPTVLETR